MYVKKVILTVSILTAVIVCGAWYLWGRVPQPAVAAYPPPVSLADAHRQDLDYLRQLIVLDRSFSDSEQKGFEDELAAIEERAHKLGTGEFEMGIAHAVALADNGHTNVLGTALGKNLPTIPVRLSWFEEGLFVVSAAPALECAVAHRITAIDGRDPEALVTVLRPYIGGTAVLARYLALNFMVSPGALHAIGVSRKPDVLHLTLEESDCRTTLVVADALIENDASKKDRWPIQYLSPTGEHWERGAWSHALAGKELPLYLRNPDNNYWSETLDDAILYVQFRRMRDHGKVSLQEFSERLLRQVEAARPKIVIMDLRASPGGDASQLLGFTRRLPKLLPDDGQLFVIVGRNTFSAAIITAARLKHFGDRKTVLVGEEMADGGQFWADGGRIVLPNSGLEVSYATWFHDWSNGCSIWQINTCYWRVYVNGVDAGDLSPDYEVPLTFSDYIRGEDSVMKFVLDLARPAEELPTHRRMSAERMDGGR